MVGSLRKQLARADIDTARVAEILEEHDSQENSDKVLESLKKRYTCFKCPDGVLEIILYSKAGKEFYHRQCNQCENRTKSKSYDSENVKGEIKKVE